MEYLLTPSPLYFILALFSLCLLSFTVLRFWPFALSSLFILFWVNQMPKRELGSIPFLEFFFSSERIFFSNLIASLGFLIGIYSFFAISKSRSRFFGQLAFFQMAAVTVTLANHTLLLFTAWELTALASFLLIGFDQSENARKNAFTALWTTTIGGLALFAALAFLSERFGSYQLSTLIPMMITSPVERVPNGVLALIFLAALTKSAQFPFHFWLPKAMTAPTPISAYLHSSALVKLGIFLLVLFWPALKTHSFWHQCLCSVGLISFAYGGLRALNADKLKEALAFSTIAQLGAIITLLGFRTNFSLGVALFLVLAHAIYKAALFLCAGIMMKISVSEKISEMRSLGSRSPALALVFSCAAASMLGVPGFLGSYGKKILTEIMLAGGPIPNVNLFTWICFSLGSLGMAGLVGKLSFHPFWDGKKSRSKILEFFLLLAPAVLAAASLVGGLWPKPAFEYIESLVPGFHFSDAVQTFGGTLYSWSLMIVGLALGLTFGFRKVELRFPTNLKFSLSPLKKFLLRLDLKQDQFFQYASLGIVLLFFVCSGIFAPRALARFETDFTLDRTGLLHASVLTLGILSLSIYWTKNSLLRIFLLGVLGYCVALIWSIFGAPDLLLTQILIETASLALLAMAYFLSPRLKTGGSRFDWIWLLPLSAFLSYQFFFFTENLGPKLSSLYFFENSELLAGGKNIVNLIIVDFRGLDTLGEMTVFSLAYFGAAALMSRVPGFPKRYPLPKFPFQNDWTRSVTQVLFWFLLGSSIWFLLRGHENPGGGFIAGLLLGLALALRSLVHRKANPHRGLCVAGLAIGYLAAFLPALHTEFFQSFKMNIGPSSLFFDMGVFLSVAGSLSGMLEFLWRYSGGKTQEKSA